MGNKAQYCVILLDPDAKNEEGDSYLEKKLEILQNQDLKISSGIQSTVRSALREPSGSSDGLRPDSPLVPSIQFTLAEKSSVKSSNESGTLSLDCQEKLMSTEENKHLKEDKQMQI